MKKNFTLLILIILSTIVRSQYSFADDYVVDNVILQSDLTHKGYAYNSWDTDFNIITSALATITQYQNNANSLTTDSLALVALYNSTGGDNWINNENWLTGRLKDWEGVSVVDGRITGLHLTGNNLQGNLPGDIGDLSALTQLSLYNNKLTGNIPNEIGNLSELKYLHLFNNELTGNLPGTIDNLTKLESIQLGNNKLSGNLPAFQNLNSLRGFNVYDNMLEGNLPNSLFSINSLEEINVEGNLITGSIPENLEILVNLEVLNLDDNLIDSLPDLVLPSSLKFISVQANKLTFEDLEYNIDEFNKRESYYNDQKPYGTEKTVALKPGQNYLLQTSCGGSQNYYRWYRNNIPISEYSDSPEFRILNFNNSDIGKYYCKVKNDLARELTLESEPIFLQLKTADPCNVSDSLALIALYNSTDGTNWNIDWDLNAWVGTWNGITMNGNRVTEIILNNNNLTGTLPDEMADLTELETLHLIDNNLSGTLQSLSNLEKLDYIVCDNNQFSGDLAPFSNKSNMYWLSFENNQLTGTIEPLMGLTMLRGIYLNGNQINGGIPSDIGELIQLERISLHQNQLTGSIPSTIGQLTKLEVLYLNENSLDGEIPSEIGQIDSLIYLYLYSNQLAGNIPSEIGNLQNLKRFYADNNQLTGGIPASIGNLINLQYLGLYQNSFSGSIPSEIGNLSNLYYLSLFENNLSGSIPSSIGNLSNLGILSIRNNQLSGDIPSEIGNLPNLTALMIANNNFYHKNIESIFNWENYSNIENFVYAPQGKIGNEQTVQTAEGEDISILFSNYVPSNSDTYQWFKDSEEITGAVSPVLNLSSVDVDDAGIYHCVISNSVTTELTLVSNNITVEISKMQSYTVTFNDWDGSVLKTETVVENGFASAPDNPTREGYTFTGWDITFEYITSNLTVTAQYTKNDVSRLVVKVKNGEAWSPENPFGDGDNNNVSVLLLDYQNPDKNNPLFSALSNQDGNAIFENVPYGEYYIYAERGELCNLLESEIINETTMGFIPFGNFQSEASVAGSNQPNAYVGGPRYTDYNNDKNYNADDKKPGELIDISENSESTTIYIFNSSSNRKPIANAFTYSSINEGGLVKLNGSASFDPDGDSLSYLWIVPDGITLDDTKAVSPIFTAPRVAENSSFTFMLVVTDDEANSDSAIAEITIKNVYPELILSAFVENILIDSENILYSFYKKDGDSYRPTDLEILEEDTFTMFAIEPGEWIVVASSIKKPGLFLPTYVGNTAEWSKAEHLIVEANETLIKEIDCIEKFYEQQGKFEISGYVYADSSGSTKSVIVSSQVNSNKTPLPNISVYLFETGNDIFILSTKTDSLGFYKFNKLTEGDYEVRIDLPGYSQPGNYIASLNNETPEKDFTFVVNTGSETITNTGGKYLFSKITLYPNPSAGKACLDVTLISKSEVEISITSIMGAEILRKKYQNSGKIIFDLSDHASGMYFVKIKTTENEIVKKLILNRQ